MQIRPASYAHAKVIWDPSDYPAADLLKDSLTARQLQYWEGTNTDRSFALLFKSALEVEDEDILMGDPVNVRLDQSVSYPEQYSSILAARLSIALGRVTDAYTAFIGEELAHELYQLAKKHVYVYRHLEDIPEEQAYIELLNLFYALWLKDGRPRALSSSTITAKWTKLFDWFAIDASQEWLTKAQKVLAISFSFGIPPSMVDTYESVFMAEISRESEETIDRLALSLVGKKSDTLTHHTLINLKDGAGSWDAVASMIESVPFDVLVSVGYGN